MSDRLTSSVVIVPQSFADVAQIEAAAPHDPPFVTFWPSGDAPELHARVDAADTVLVVDVARDEQLDAILERAVRDGKNVVRSRRDALDDTLRRTLTARKEAFHLDVFISYAREDGDFAASVAADLRHGGKSVWMDRLNIRPSEPWLRAVHSGIDAADHVLAILSPAFLASAACAEELAYAAANGKHLVPLLCQPVDEPSLPEPIRLLNWIDFAAGERVKAMAALVEALETDFAHVQVHTRLLNQAKEWDASARDGARLLRGRALRDAESWLAAAEGRRPAARPVQRELIHASLRRRRLWRIAWGSVATLAAAMLLAIPFLNLWLIAANVDYYDCRVAVIAGVLALAAAGWHFILGRRRRTRVPRALAFTCCALAVCPGWGTPSDDAMRTAIYHRDYPMLSRLLTRDAGRISNEVSDALSVEVDKWTPDADDLLEFLIRYGYDPARLATSSFYPADCRRSLGDSVSLRIARLIAPRLTKEQRSVALKYAAFAGRPGVAALYLAHGREGAVEAFNEALQCTGADSMFSKHPEITKKGCHITARLLVDIVPLEERTQGDDETPLMCAAREGDLAAVRRLIARGANPNAVSRYGETALTRAALYSRSFDITRLLVERGVTIEQKNRHEQPLRQRARAAANESNDAAMRHIADYLDAAAAQP
jgi:TIR domain/Ankyrin repeats (3 copies)